MTHALTYFSTFSGIGGFEAAIQTVHHEAICIGYSEINKYAAQIYRSHFPTHTNFGDITKIDANRLPEFNFLIGGFPCQAFSLAGKRDGFDDVRGTLFFEIARLLGQKQPRLFLLENVKGLLSHDAGHTFHTILATLDELGYDLQWQVLNSKDFGVPQNRERVFIVGHLRGTPRPEIFSLGKDDGECHAAERRQTQITGTINSSMAKGGNMQDANARVLVGTFRTHKSGGGFREIKSGLAPTIPARAREDGSGQPVIQQRPTGKFRCGLHKARVAAIRRLTPLECERLQGFPDGWTAGVSDTQRYKCLGNAVTVPVVRAIISRMFPASPFNQGECS